jgi:hypothetical protein
MVPMVEEKLVAAPVVKPAAAPSKKATSSKEL